MRRTVFVAFGCVIACAAQANSITTLFNRNNGGSNGGAVYFDLTVNSNPILITGFDTNTNDVSVTFGWTVWTRSGTSVGFEGSSSGWSIAATGSGQAMGMNIASPVTLNNPISVSANSLTGIALVIGPEAGHDYSGTGTSPSPGQLQYSNADLTLDLGSAGNVAFSGTPFRPRIWNGTIHYNVVPEPASLAALSLGAVALIRRRRK